MQYHNLFHNATVVPVPMWLIVIPHFEYKSCYVKSHNYQHKQYFHNLSVFFLAISHIITNCPSCNVADTDHKAC